MYKLNEEEVCKAFGISPEHLNQLKKNGSWQATQEQYEVLTKSMVSELVYGESNGKPVGILNGWKVNE